MPDLRKATEQAKDATSEVRDTAGGGFGFLKGAFGGLKAGLSGGAILGALGSTVLAVMKDRDNKVAGYMQRVGVATKDTLSKGDLSQITKTNTVVVGTGAVALALGAIFALAGGIGGAYRQGKEKAARNGSKTHESPQQQPHTAPEASKHENGSEAVASEHTAAWTTRTGTLEQRQAIIAAQQGAGRS